MSESLFTYIGPIYIGLFSFMSLSLFSYVKQKTGHGVENPPPRIFLSGRQSFSFKHIWVSFHICIRLFFTMCSFLQCVLVSYIGFFSQCQRQIFKETASTTAKVLQDYACFGSRFMYIGPIHIGLFSCVLLSSIFFHVYWCQYIGLFSHV